MPPSCDELLSEGLPGQRGARTGGSCSLSWSDDVVIDWIVGGKDAVVVLKAERFASCKLQGGGHSTNSLRDAWDSEHEWD